MLTRVLFSESAQNFENFWFQIPSRDSLRFDQMRTNKIPCATFHVQIMIKPNFHHRKTDKPFDLNHKHFIK